MRMFPTPDGPAIIDEARISAITSNPNGTSVHLDNGSIIQSTCSFDKTCALVGIEAKATDCPTGKDDK